jgi:hypothetical protein
MKKLLALLIPSVFLAFSATPAKAYRIEPTPVTCWFLRGEKLELIQKCTYSFSSWAGGGSSSLTWEDGVKTFIAFGKQSPGSGQPNCPDKILDKVCASTYYRDPKNFARISKAERDRRLSTNNRWRSIECVEANSKSICFFFNLN